MDTKIYLHWSATSYRWNGNSYHSVIDDQGNIKRNHSYYEDIPSHTYMRNTNSIGIAVACMGERPWVDYPPTARQIEALCQEVARVCRDVLGWGADKVSIQTVMTHAEAASNKDGWFPHENYGPVDWGGKGERWDLWMLSRKEKPGTGGDRLRTRIKEILQGGDTTPDLDYVSTAKISLNGKDYGCWIDRVGKAWVDLFNLSEAYGFELESSSKRILIHGPKLRPPKNGDYAEGLKSYTESYTDVIYTPNPKEKLGEIPCLKALWVDDIPFVRATDFGNEFSLPVRWDAAARKASLGAMNLER